MSQKHALELNNEMPHQVIRTSVRNLVEFVLRSGDIDNRVGKGVRQEAMLQGSRMHRKIQNRMGSGYRAEVSMKVLLPGEYYDVSLEGRADGVYEGHIEDEELVIIDEIKCMYADVNRLEEPIQVHRAQAMCYAWILAKDEGLSRVGIQITYCNLDTEEIKRFSEAFEVDTLDEWFRNVIEGYRKWTDFQYHWTIRRNASIKGLEFPFPYREGQRKLAGDVYRTIARHKLLFLQAPTGTGKTISTVFPAVKAVGEGIGDKIFYLTAKTITRTVAREAFQILKGKGYEGKVLSLTAKEKLCPCEEMDCNPVNCSYAKGHYDRVNDAVYELITEYHDLTREQILETAEKHQVCPFEMALDASLWSDVIICDYNYVFDPNVYLKRFFAEGEKGEYIFLIDEAHNLVERGREMYSAVLVKEDFLAMKKILRKYQSNLPGLLEKCNRQMLAWKRECETYRVLESAGNFVFALMNLMSRLDEFLQRRLEFPERKEVTEFYFSLRHFLNMFDYADENYVLYTDYDGENRFLLHLYCVNPAANLQECLDRGLAGVFFSATLLPVNYYKKLLSTRQDNYAVYASTVFSPEQHKLFVARDVSSLYTRRNVTEYQRIAAYIRRMGESRKGNYIVFFPSYRFMEDVYAQIDPDGEGITVLVQGASMGEQQREEFLAEFEQEREESLIAFCVLGGIFSEGIDLKAERLIGVLIVGTGLPQICNEREILKGYYNGEIAPVNGGEVVADGDRGLGFAYAYQYPGMNKVLQAAGRVIRTAEDRGVIGLLDDRFLRRDYRELFPREWSAYTVENLDTVSASLAAFWQKNDGESF